jgi:hypothetical protein
MAYGFCEFPRISNYNFVVYDTKMLYTLLIISLPTENTTARMRAWRALKGCGAAVLRDGVYVMPSLPQTLSTLSDIADDVQAHGGTAYQLELADSVAYDFAPMFDRKAEFSAFMADIELCGSQLNSETAADNIKQVRKLRKAFTQLVSIDFFPSEAQRQTEHALTGLELKIHQTLSPNEPSNLPASDIAVIKITDYQGRVWATRCRPWADRLACAWLIRRFIDSQATVLWLKDSAVCPKKALGFDFDGARFTHVGAKVTFEVMLASFDLQTPALLRLGTLIHYLDLGGIEPAEASGVERVLKGLCSAITNDDELLATASTVFDALLTAFETERADQ